MKKLTVLFDPECAFCWSCRAWLVRQAAFIELEFVSRDSPQVKRRFPSLRDGEAADDLIVISDSGDVYRGPNAFIICLYALKQYRELSLWLASSSMRPFSRRAFEILSKRRGLFSWFLSKCVESKIPLAAELAAEHCQGQRCRDSYGFTETSWKQEAPSVRDP